ncbi:MAG: phage tail protein [Archaeoglobaceae archaeon]
MNRRLAVLLAAVFIVSIAVTVSAVNGREEPYPKYKFRVEIDGIVQAGFNEAEGLNVNVSVVEYRDGTDLSNAPQLVPGTAHYGPLVLKNGVTESNELWMWMEETIDGSMTKRNMAVIIQDWKGNDVKRILLTDAWPSSWKMGKLEANPSPFVEEPLLEEIVIQYEGMEVKTVD